jgi:hypothetical protein
MSKKENKIKKGNSFNAFYRNQYGISAAKLINIPAIIGVPIFIIQLI